ncbi:hypothetical protein CR513_15325, partial [Mucuna pruriens]
MIEEKYITATRMGLYSSVKYGNPYKPYMNPRALVALSNIGSGSRGAKTVATALVVSSNNRNSSNNGGLRERKRDLRFKILFEVEMFLKIRKGECFRCEEKYGPDHIVYLRSIVGSPALLGSKPISSCMTRLRCLPSKREIRNYISHTTQFNIVVCLTWYQSRVLLCLCLVRLPLFTAGRPPSSIVAGRHRRLPSIVAVCRLPPLAADRRRKVLSQYPVTESCRCHYPPLSATVRPSFSDASPPFCSLAHLLPIPTPKNLVGSTVAGRSKLPCCCFLLQVFMGTTGSFSQVSIISFSRTPTITTEKLNWKNYRAWSESVELWFLGQGFLDHLEKQEAEILEENRVPWLKLDYQLYSVSPELLEILRSFKTCYSFWTNARDVFANDIERLFDSTQKIICLQQTNHDMMSHIAKVRAAAEEFKGLLVCNFVEETTKRIDKLLMVLILRSLYPNYEHVQDQILSSEQIPSMNSLVTRLLRVPTITKGNGIAVGNSAMVASRGRGRSGRGTRGILRNGKGGRGRLICSHYGKEGHLQNRCYDLIGWPDKTANIFSSDTPSNGKTDSQLILDEEYQEFLRLKSSNHTQSSASPSVSTACIS